MHKTKFEILKRSTFSISLYEYDRCLYAHIVKGNRHQLREYDLEGEFLRESKWQPYEKFVTFIREDKFVMAATDYFKGKSSFNFPIPTNQPFLVERFINWEGSI